jgi:HSP20 family protein
MENSSTNSRSPRLLTAAVVLLCLVALLQLGILLQRHSAGAGRSRRKPPPVEQLWSHADAMEAMHERINHLFDQAFRYPLGFPPGPAATAGASTSSPAGQDPFASMRRMQRQIDAAFVMAMNDLPSTDAPFDEAWTGLVATPGLDIADNGQSYEVSVSLPGVAKSGILVRLEDDILTVIAEREMDAAPARRDGRRLTVQAASRIERKLRLPGATRSSATVKASFENDILRITVPKATGDEPPRQGIPVT